MSLILPHSTFLTVFHTARWSRLCASWLKLGTAFAAGALCAGILAKLPPDAPASDRIISEAAAAGVYDVAPMPDQSTVAAEIDVKKLAEETRAQQKATGVTAIAANIPPQAAVMSAPIEAKPVATGTASQARVARPAANGTIGATRTGVKPQKLAKGSGPSAAKITLKATSDTKRGNKHLAKRNSRTLQARNGSNNFATAQTGRLPGSVRAGDHRKHEIGGTALARNQQPSHAFFSFLGFGNLRL